MQLFPSRVLILAFRHAVEIIFESESDDPGNASNLGCFFDGSCSSGSHL